MYNDGFMLDRLERQKEEIENLMRRYQQQPVNNIINTTQAPNRDMIEWRILNENEEVDNLYVQSKTLFVSDDLMILKGVDGSLEKWEVKKVYPIDKKDEKINALEEEIKNLKEMMSNEYAKSSSSVDEFKQSNDNVSWDAEPKPKANSKSVSKQKQ